MDAVIQGFRESAVASVNAINRATDRLKIVADPFSGSPPTIYHVLLEPLEHFERDPVAGVRVVTRAIAAALRIPDDYLRSSDGSLQFRVASTEPRVFHPNCKAGCVCLGPRFAPGTTLRSLVAQLYDLLSSRVFASDHGFDPEASRFYLENIERVAAIRASAPPLWRRPLAASVRVEELRARPEEGAR
jgi:hypothetical protein